MRLSRHFGAQLLPLGIIAVLTAGCAPVAGPAQPQNGKGAPAITASPTLALPPAIPSPQTTPAASTSTTIPASAMEGPGGTLAAQGKTVYASQCSLCHGEQGQGVVGPALIGGRANLGRFGTGRALYDYIRVSMPQSAPGSLTSERYFQATIYLLVENKLVQEAQLLNEAALDSVNLQP